jgi:hypothetical protein
VPDGLGPAEPPRDAKPIDPAPPRGVVLPRGTIVVSATDGERKAAFVWLGTFALDPADPDASRRIATARSSGQTLELVDAVLEMYREDVAAAGLENTGFGFMRGFDYTVGSGPDALGVFVRVPADNPLGPPVDADEPVGDDNGPYIEIIAGPLGG